jgi:hypothetical protein
MAEAGSRATPIRTFRFARLIPGSGADGLTGPDGLPPAGVVQKHFADAGTSRPACVLWFSPQSGSRSAILRPESFPGEVENVRWPVAAVQKCVFEIRLLIIFSGLSRNSR